MPLMCSTSTVGDRGPVVSHGGEMGTETCQAMGVKNHEKPLGKHMPGAGTSRFFYLVAHPT